MQLLRGKQGVTRVGLVLIIILSVLCCSKKTPTSPNHEKSELATITGMLILPAEANGKTFAVVVDSDTNNTNGFVRVIMGTCGTGDRVPYEITDVPAGIYFLYAVVWVVSEPLNPPATGDFVGFYGTENAIPPAPNVTIPTSGQVTLDITLMVLP